MGGQCKLVSGFVAKLGQPIFKTNSAGAWASKARLIAALGRTQAVVGHHSIRRFDRNGLLQGSALSGLICPGKSLRREPSAQLHL